MSKIGLFLLLILSFFSGHPAGATDQAEARQQTKDFLLDQKQRDELIKKDAKALEADLKVQELTGGSEKDRQAIYELAAEVFADSEKIPTEQMQQILEQAKGDPENFASGLTDKQKAKLRSIAESIEAKKKKP